MKRRTLLGLTTSTIAGSFAIGSGAFTSVNAERTVTVEVAGDDEAFLVIDAGAVDTAGRSSLVSLDPDINTPHEASFQIPGTADDQIGGTDPEGIGQDSVYKFASMAVIRNQGTQPINVYSEHNGKLENISIFDVDGPETPLTSSDDSVSLDTGEEFTMGLRIESGNQNTGEYDETITIVGESHTSN